MNTLPISFRRAALPTCLVLGAALSPGLLHAQEADVTLTVPIELQEIPMEGMRGFQVRCLVFDRDGTPVRAQNAVGTGHTISPIIPLNADGSYTGPPVTLEMTFPNLSTREKRDLSTYQCEFWLNVDGYGGIRPYYEADAQPAFPWQAMVADGSELVVRTEGPLGG